MGAFAIDLGIMMIVSIPAIWIPLLPALIVTVYQLMRDYRGASLGKRVLGLRVANRGGGPATTAQCILRNIIFVVPTLALFIPGIGFFVDYGGGGILYIVELILLLATGSRIGDRIAATIVPKGR